MDTQTNEGKEFEKRAHVRPKQLKLGYKLLIGFGAGLLASGLGIILPIVGAITILAVILSVMVGLIVYGAADHQGLGAFLLTFEVCQVLIGGILVGGVMLLIVVLPLTVMAFFDMRKLPFFKRLYLSLAVELIGLVLALGLIVLIYRQNIGDLTVKLLKKSFSEIPQSLKDSLASYYRQLYSAMGIAQKYESADDLFNSVAETCGEYIKLALPAMLIVYASINVLPGVKIASTMRVNRYLPGATTEPARNWRLNEQMIVGLILILATGFILNWTLDQRGEVVMITALVLGGVACCIQTIASLSDRLGKMPMGTGMKVAFCVLFALFFLEIVPYYGAMSMLIGSHGLITLWLKRRNSDRQDPDGPF